MSNGMAENHERIWLSPLCETEERTWCSSPQHCEEGGCCLPAIEYIRADLVPAAQEWQDISTAPMDGTIVLIGGTNSKGKFFMADAMWDRAWRGWMLFHPDHDSYSAECHQASHWHPLPAPPIAVIADHRAK